MAISPKTQEIIDAIKEDPSEMITPCIYSWAFRSRANTSAAFRIAKEQGIIEVSYMSAAGTPVYRHVEG